jgi:hypothetical protein
VKRDIGNFRHFTRLYKVKQSSPATRHGGACGEGKYSSYSFLTSALDEGDWSASRLGRALPWERTPDTLCTGAWVSLRAGLDTKARGKILCPCRASNPDRPVVQSVVSHYTDWATPVPLGYIWKYNHNLLGLCSFFLSCLVGGQATGFLTGHVHLEGHHFNVGVSDSRICGRCHMEAETASRMLCECVALAGLRFCPLGKHYTEPSDYDEIPICKALYFVRGTRLLRNKDDGDAQ